MRIKAIGLSTNIDNRTRNWVSTGVGEKFTGWKMRSETYQKKEKKLKKKSTSEIKLSEFFNSLPLTAFFGSV